MDFFFFLLFISGMDEQQGSLCLLSNCAVAGHLSKKQCFQISINGKVREPWQREWVAASEAGRSLFDGGGSSKKVIHCICRKDLTVSETWQEKVVGGASWSNGSEHKCIAVKSVCQPMESWARRKQGMVLEGLRKKRKLMSILAWRLCVCKKTGQSVTAR